MSSKVHQDTELRGNIELRYDGYVVRSNEFAAEVLRYLLQKRDEQKVELEKKQRFIDGERKKTIERLKQYKMVSTSDFASTTGHGN